MKRSVSWVLGLLRGTLVLENLAQGRRTNVRTVIGVRTFVLTPF